jgi:multisubunit Na+/H+ antiporter MnhF subunit
MFDALLLTLMAILGISLLVSAARIIREPQAADLALALEMVLLHIIGMLALYAIAVRQFALIDMVPVLATVSLLISIACAYFIERGEPR